MRLVNYFIFIISLTFLSNRILAQKTTVEEVKPICENLSPSDKPILAVAPFKIATNANVGAGLSDMMMNALFNGGCFRVVERERLNILMEEQGMGLSGAGDESSFAKIGKQIGAQLIVMGTITEFSENESGGGVGGGILRRVPGIGGVGMRKAHIGYTIRLVNPSTGEIIAMQSFDKKRNSVGLAAGGRFGSVLGGAVFYKSKAMQDAIEESLIEAVAYISNKKKDFQAFTSEAQKSISEDKSTKAEKEKCGALQLVRKPRIMVIIPEEHLAGAGSSYDPNRANTINVNVNKEPTSTNNSAYGSGQNNTNNAGTETLNNVRNMFRPPDPAGETEIMKKLLEFGFDVVDAKQYEKIRTEKQFQDAFDNPAIASQIASRYGADIIIVGEAFSEYAKSGNNMTSCRARVEAKAIMVRDAKILATDGLHGSGLDISEVIAGKTALRNAGSKIADYFLVQLCAKSEEIATSFGSGSNQERETEITFKNIEYSKVSLLAKLLENAKNVSKSERRSFSNNIAMFVIKHSGGIDELIERLIANSKTAGIKLEVTGVSENAASILIK